MYRLDSSSVYHSPRIDEFGWLQHGFGTRRTTGWPDTPKLTTVKQIHSDKVLIAVQPGQIGPGDALISQHPGVTIAIRTADCLPIVIVDPGTRTVAAVHAGWRGVVAEILPKTIEEMKRQFGSRSEDLVIEVGPCIQACCFEVGPEVAIEFQALFPERNDLDRRTHIDLVETTRRQLGRNGVAIGQIGTSDLCTCCNPELFESYRRDREKAGRMVTAVGILKNQ